MLTSENKKVIVILTDGKSDAGVQTGVIDSLYEDGISVTAMGVGSGVNTGELEMIAGSTGKYYTTLDFDTLNTTVD